MSFFNWNTKKEDDKQVQCQNYNKYGQSIGFKVNCFKVDCTIDYFKVLGITGPHELTAKFFRELSLKYHPDKTKDKSKGDVASSSLQKIKDIFFINKKEVNQKFLEDYVETYKVPKCGFYKTYESKTGAVYHDLREIQKAGGFAAYWDQSIKSASYSESSSIPSAQDNKKFIETSLSGQKVIISDKIDSETCSIIDFILQVSSSASDVLQHINLKGNPENLVALKTCLEKHQGEDLTPNLIDECTIAYSGCDFTSYTAEL